MLFIGGMILKKGLVLEGGAMRGMFTAGVLDVMMEHQIKINGIIGVSAGAAFGCNYKSNQPGRVIRYNTTYSRDSRFCGLSSWIRTGDFYNAAFCYHEIPEKLDLFDEETFCNSSMEFYAVCTDVETGTPVYHKCESTADENVEWIRASASLPLAARMVSINNRKYLDGSISDSIPLKYFQTLGYDKNIVILTREKGYLKKKDSLLPLMNLLLRKHPNILNTMKKRHITYNEQVAYAWNEKELGNAFIICPKEPLPISRTERDFQKLRAVYEIGRQTALEHIDELKHFF